MNGADSNTSCVATLGAKMLVEHEERGERREDRGDRDEREERGENPTEI